MKTKAWRKLLTMGFVVTAFAAGCVISSDDDDDDDGTGGTGGSGGSGGSSGSSGSGGRDGSAGTGGTGGFTYACSDPVPRDDAGAEDECQKCIQTECCTDFLACANGDRGNCWGDDGEMFCIQDCILDYVEANDEPAPGPTKESCISDCQIGSTPRPATNNLFGCIDTGDRGDAAPGNGCAVECFGG